MPTRQDMTENIQWHNPMCPPIKAIIFLRGSFMASLRTRMCLKMHATQDHHLLQETMTSPRTTSHGPSKLTRYIVCTILMMPIKLPWHHLNLKIMFSIGGSKCKISA